MTTQSRTTKGVVALAGLACLAACGSRSQAPDSVIAKQLPVAETRPVAASAGTDPGGLAGVTEPTASATPSASASASESASGQGGARAVEKPSVAKTQRWVKIFSGPSEK